MSQQHSDQDPEEDRGVEFRDKARGGKERKMRNRQKEGDSQGKGGRRNDRGDHGKSYSVGPTEPSENVFSKFAKDHPEIGNHDEHPADPPVETTPVTRQAAPTVVATEVTPSPAPAPIVSSGPTSKSNERKEIPMTSANSVQPLRTEDDVTYKRLGDKTLERATTAAAALADIARIEKMILENPEFGNVELVKQQLATAYEVVDKVQIPPLVDRIRTSRTDQINELVSEAIKLGMQKVATASGPRTFYWRGQTYVSPRDNKTWESLMIELNKLKGRMAAEARHERLTNLDAMRKEATGLTLYEVFNTERGKPFPTGKFIVFLPGQKPQKPGDRQHYDSHILVEVRKEKEDFFVLQPLKAVGEHERLLDTLTDEGKKKAPFIPVFYFFERDPKIVEEKLVKSLGEDKGKATARMCRILKTALFLERDAKRQTEAKAKTATPAVVPTEAPAALEAVPTVEATDPPAEAPEATIDETSQATMVLQAAKENTKPEKPKTPRKRAPKAKKDE